MPDQDLAPEIAEFERLYDSLKEQFGADEWIVISASVFQGHFSRFSDAAMFVAANFQDQPALVRQIDSQPVHVPYVLMRA